MSRLTHFILSAIALMSVEQKIIVRRDFNRIGKSLLYFYALKLIIIMQSYFRKRPDYLYLRNAIETTVILHRMHSRLSKINPTKEVKF